MNLGLVGNPFLIISDATRLFHSRRVGEGVEAVGWPKLGLSILFNIRCIAGSRKGEYTA